MTSLPATTTESSEPASDSIRRLLEETDDLRVVREASNGEEYLAEINRLHQISPSSISTFPTATGLIC
jgi:hypothetical protein